MATSESRESAYAAFRLYIEPELEFAAGHAANPGTKPSRAEHWAELRRMWQTALDMMDLYHRDPLFAGRVDSAIHEDKQRQQLPAVTL